LYGELFGEFKLLAENDSFGGQESKFADWKSCRSAWFSLKGCSPADCSPNQQPLECRLPPAVGVQLLPWAAASISKLPLFCPTG